MISLELARKLKEAGLEWEPQRGDMYYPPDDDCTYIPMFSQLIFAPRLDQLLAEIEKLGYTWFAETDTERYFIRVVEIKKPNNFHVIFSDSPADAAAEALLWILEGRTDRD